MRLMKYILTTALAAILSIAFVFSSLALTVTEDKTYTWKKVESSWTCKDSDGDPVTGWAKKGSDIYYLDKKGSMRTGWIKYSGDWYYLDDKTGVLLTSQWVDNYYVDKEGKMTKIK